VYDAVCKKVSKRPMSKADANVFLQTVINQGGLAPGGLNFDCKVRRESTDVVDMMIAHVGAMDCFAKALRVAAKIKQDGILDRMRNVSTK